MYRDVYLHVYVSPTQPAPSLPLTLLQPGNFCLPLAGKSQESDVYLLDFGFAREMPNPADPPKPGSFVGTPDYASSNALSSVAQSARDDLESLAYTLLEMYEGEFYCSIRAPQPCMHNHHAAPSVEHVPQKTQAHCLPFTNSLILFQRLDMTS